jgi:hypothetical protein
MDVTGEDDPFRSVLLWFRKRFPAFEVYGPRRVEGRGRYRGVSVSIHIERPKIKSQEQVHQIVSLKVSSPPPQLVIERLAEMVQANPWGIVEIETWREHASRQPTLAFPEDSYFVAELNSGNKVEVLSSDGHFLRKLRRTQGDEPLQAGEEGGEEGIQMAADSYAASEARRLAQLLAEESDQSLARIPSGVLQRFVQEAREAIEQVARHRFEEGDSVMIKVDVPLIRGEFMRHEDGEAENRIKVPMVDVRPGDREGD